MNPQQPLRAGQPLTFAPPPGPFARPPSSGGGNTPNPQMGYGRPPMPPYGNAQVSANQMNQAPPMRPTHPQSDFPRFPPNVMPPGPGSYPNNNVIDYQQKPGGQQPLPFDQAAQGRGQISGPPRMPPPQQNPISAFVSQPTQETTERVSAAPPRQNEQDIASAQFFNNLSSDPLPPSQNGAEDFQRISANDDDARIQDSSSLTPHSADHDDSSSIGSLSHDVDQISIKDPVNEL